ncbi:MAG: HepT-like ribonuclease domain-containing protein [Nanoarchaeota archaeon]
MSLIEDFSKGLTIEKLEGDKLKQSAIIRQIEIIGEAIKNLPETFTEKYPQVMWKNIAGTRDRIIHQYFDIDIVIVWDIITKDLSVLKKQIEEIISKEKVKV